MGLGVLADGFVVCEDPKFYYFLLRSRIPLTLVAYCTRIKMVDYPFWQ